MHSTNEIKQMKLGLAAICEIDAQLGYPSRAFPSIHVAGTNGKGSVATKIAKGLELSGKRVGLFTSPHIACISERIQINGEKIPLHTLERLWMKELTYFEAVTMAAFAYFAEQKVDIAVIEVGLGGRLDATNIITPLISVITSIDFDHMEYLGDTLEAIAREKAGIIKAGIPAVMGPRVQPRHCFPNEHWVEEAGSYEEENRAIAKKVLKLLGVPLLGLETTPPCRFQKVGKVIFDVAHNPAGLKRTLERIEGPFGCLAAFSKHPKQMREILAKAAPFVVTSTDHERLLPGDEPDFSKAFREVYENCDQMLITGSFFFMERAQEELRRVMERELP